MKKYLSAILLVFLQFLVITGCKKHSDISDKQIILFQFEYINYAWGYQHEGFIIDNEGNILTFNNPQDWNFRDRESVLTESQVAENINQCQHSGKKVSQADLRKYSGYIKNIASSKVTALKNVAADAGSYEYFCFQYSENNETYKGYIIKMEGDFTCENLNFFSKKVTAWMKVINSSLQTN